MVDVLFGHEGDLGRDLGEPAAGPVWHTLESFEAMAGRISAEFPNLRVIASTVRRVHTASRNTWGGFAFAENVAHQGMCFPDLEIFDRVGGGDAFAAGVIYGLIAGKGIGWALDCGLAHGALTMTTPGDASFVSSIEVERVMSGESAHTLR